MRSASENAANPPSANALAVYQTTTPETTVRAPITAALNEVTHAAMRHTGARKIARSLRNPMAMAQAALATTSARPRPSAAAAARQKSRAQAIESAARSVYG